ncbi:hypothetical protein HQ529_06375 [Candidatus Woesearchaeota archaeon]|nr:hypothetical protein [Candidatus Woesearchaeota archaeon]
MKKSVIILLLLGILLVSPLILAKEQAQTYSGFNRFTNDVKMFFASGNNKVKLALEIREKEIDSAISNSQNQNEKDAIKNLERAHKKLQVVREKISLDVADEVKESVDEIVNKIKDKEDLSDNFEVYVLEEEKTQLTAELIKKTFEWCKELASEDYTLMLQEEQCNPDTAISGLEEELKELKNLQEELFVQLMLDIRSCIDDPGTCNCEDNVDIGQKAKCEKMVALAVKCEYKDDENACSELKSMGPVKGDDFAESFVPDFLINLFRKKSYMIDYNIKKSDVPPGCYNENNKPECEQYRHMKETSSKCWDKDGNFLEEKCGEPKDKEPTMQESIPQCYDENNNFLEEKCGEITIVWNEEGLINYLIGKEIDNIINEFENSSEQHQIDINGSLEQTKILEVKGEIGEVEENIKGWVVDHPVGNEGGDDDLTWEIKTEIAKDGEGTGGLTLEIKNEMDVGNNNGDDGLTPEIETDVAGGSNEGNNNVVDEGMIVEDGINDIIKEGGENQIDKPPKDKEDVSPPVDDFVNVVDEDENPSEHGTVGD